MTGSMFMKSISELEKIILVCKKYDVPVTGSCFYKSADVLEKIIKVCREYGLEIKGNVLKQDAEDIKRIIILCKKYNLKIVNSMFIKNAQEFENIVNLCNEEGISITPSIFLQSFKELKKSIAYVKTNFGKEYLTVLVVNKNVKYLENVLPYLNELGVLPVVIKSASILTLSLEEIKMRKEYIENNGEDMVLPNGRFNSVFSLSRKTYERLVGVVR